MSLPKWYEQKAVMEWLDFEEKRLSTLRERIVIVQKELQMGLHDTDLLDEWPPVKTNVRKAVNALARATKWLSAAKQSLEDMIKEEP